MTRIDWIGTLEIHSKWRVCNAHHADRSQCSVFSRCWHLILTQITIVYLLEGGRKFRISILKWSQFQRLNCFHHQMLRVVLNQMKLCTIAQDPLGTIAEEFGSYYSPYRHDNIFLHHMQVPWRSLQVNCRWVSIHAYSIQRRHSVQNRRWRLVKPKDCWSLAHQQCRRENRFFYWVWFWSIS